MVHREITSTQDMGHFGVVSEAEAARVAHERSRDYMGAIGGYKRREEKFKDELRIAYSMTDDEADEIIRLFKDGTIEYKVYLGYKDIIRDKLAIIREQKYTDI